MAPWMLPPSLEQLRVAQDSDLFAANRDASDLAREHSRSRIREQQETASRLRRALFEGLQQEDSEARRAGLEQIGRLVETWTSIMVQSTAAAAATGAQGSGSSCGFVAAAAGGSGSGGGGGGGSGGGEDLLAVDEPDPPSADEMWVGPYGLDEERMREYRYPYTKRRKKIRLLNPEAIENLKIIVAKYYVGLLRLSIDCPFEDVRSSAERILRRCRALGPQIPVPVHNGPSWFIPPKDVVGIARDADDETRFSRSESCTSCRSIPSSIAVTCQSDSPHSSPPRTPDEPSFGISKMTLGTTTEAIPISNPSRRRHSLARSAMFSPAEGASLAPMSSAGYRRARLSVGTSSQNIPSQLASNLPIRPSAAHSPGRLPSTSLKQLQKDLFLQYGRVSNLFRILFYFPKFAQVSKLSYDLSLTRHSGPLLRPWKAYIAIMAAAQYSCQYLVSRMIGVFLEFSGDSKWLQGIKFAPAKFRRLSRLNSLLAHQPWRLTPEDISELAHSGKDGENDHWGVTEIIQAITIMAMIHAHAGFALGCGVVQEADSFGGAIIQEDRCTSTHAGAIRPTSGRDTSTQQFHLFVTPFNSLYSNRLGKEPPGLGPSTSISQPFTLPNRNAAGNDEGQSASDNLQKRIRHRRESMHPSALHTESPIKIEGSAKQTSIPIKRVTESPEKGVFATSAQLTYNPNIQEYFSKIEFSPNRDIKQKSTENAAISQEYPVNLVVEELSRFLEPADDITYKEFDIESTEYDLLRLGVQFNWEEQGCALIARYLPGLEDTLDERISSVLDAGSEEEDTFFTTTVEQPPLDTMPLREAVMHYSLRLIGITKDDYDYENLNLLIDKPVERYLNRLCTAPNTITFSDWDGMKGFRNDEKAFLALLATEARFFGEMCHGLRAVDGWLARG